MDCTEGNAWLAKNTFSSERFLDRQMVLRMKKQKNLTVSLVIPTLDEEDTIRNTLEIVIRDLMVTYAVVDECIVMDSGSSDSTCNICEEFRDHVKLYTIQNVLPQYGTFVGKGEGLWKSIYVTKGDIIIWIDADLENLHYGFVCSLLGPLLLRDDIQFVKGFYKSYKGGRVTEICARPLLNLYWPGLSGMIEPLAGEFGGRRECLESISFTTGYGVETETLVNVYEKFGLNSIAQVDLVERRQQSQDIAGLSRMSFGIMQVVARKLKSKHSKVIFSPYADAWGESNKSKTRKTGKTKITLEGNNNCCPVFSMYEVVEQARCPMVDVKEYKSRKNNQKTSIEI